MRAARIICFQGYIYCSLLLISSKGEVSPVNWNADGLQLALWKLYHELQPMWGQTWVSVQTTLTKKEWRVQDTYESEYLSTHIYLLKRQPLKRISCSHDLLVSVNVDKRTGRVVSAMPSVMINVGTSVPLKSLLNQFNNRDVISRLLRLPDFKHSAGIARIASIEVEFGELRNRHQRWACNGFVLNIKISPETGTEQVLTYFAGSGLDPFIDPDGAIRDQAFIPKNILIDPEYAPGCEREESGARVFLKR